MTEDNTVLVVAVLAVIASLAAAGFSYYSLSQSPRIVGFAASTGVANLTVEASLEVNFTVNKVEWMSGKVTTGETFAYLDTENHVVHGNWTATNQPLVLANVGNTNVSLKLKVGSTAANFIGGSSPDYNWKVTNKDANSCINMSSNDKGWDAYADTTTLDTDFCSQFGYLTTANELEIDLNLSIPYNSKTGLLTDTITATASTAI